MSASGSISSISLLGYLTYVEIPNHGVVGGYLLVNQRARPVEFHCTAPVFASRTQEILYGRTFRTSLLCDQIGQALLNHGGKQPTLLLTDQVDALPLRSQIDTPLALFIDEKDQVALQAGELWSFEHVGCSVTTAPGFDDDRPLVRQVLGEMDSVWDLSEPLERIRAAIREAQCAAA